MKKLILFGIVTIGLILVSSCGQTPDKNWIEDRHLLEGSLRNCPIEFSSEKLCGKIEWESGPTADGESSFHLKLWDQATQSGQNPKGAIKIFLRMSCCGTVVVPQMVQVGVGDFKVSGIRFVPGNWEIHVQIRQGNATEEKIEVISLK